MKRIVHVLTAGEKQGAPLLKALLCCTLVAVAFTAGSVPPPLGTASVVSPQGGMGIDGDLIAGTPVAGVGDWLPGSDPGAASVLDGLGEPLDSKRTFHFIDPFGGMSSELIFAGGLKWTDNPNNWSWTTGKPSSKTDINNVLLHVSEDQDGHIWTIISADRASTSGDSYIDFELLQNVLVKTNGGAFISSGPDGGRTVNDLLLSLAFTGGGKVADFFAWRWLPDGLGGYAYADATASLPAGKVFVALNSNSIAVPYGAFGTKTYTPNAFAEAAVDLTALLGNFDPCLSLGVKTIMVKTKASSSSSASIEDFIEPIQYSLQIGPGADAGADQTRCSEGSSTAFQMGGKARAGMGTVTSAIWSAVKGEAIIADPGSLATSVSVSSSKAVLRLTVTQANGCTAFDDVTLSVSPLPTCGIIGPAIVCPESVQEFRAPAGQAGYVWSVSGPGQIVGPTNAASVALAASRNCGESILLQLTTFSNGCSSLCSFETLIQDTNPPVLRIPADVVTECPGDIRTNVTGVATASDDCGSATVSFTDTVTNLCGVTRIVARTWVATDICGNIGSGVQTITVRDTTSPVLVCPPEKILECPATVTTDVTGVATATDVCGAVSVNYSDEVVNGCGGTKVISRTWSATDECGHMTTAVQKITVRDTTSPSLVVPVDITLECPSDGGTNVAGVATATDGCGSVAIGFNDVVATNCGGSRIMSREWTATDLCGNSAKAVQKITIQDTEPPSLTCPPNLVLECPADTGTNATGVAWASDLCGAVSISFRDVSTNSCGAGEGILRTWTATDGCGNSTSAIQTILVHDTTRPKLALPVDAIVECPGDISTNVLGTAVASDDCGSTTITYSDAVTNVCGNARNIARTWTAADACGNTTTGVQSILVRDLTPPSLVCPPNITLECPSDGGTNVAGCALADDLCGSATLRFTDSVTAGCGASRVITRTWIASDDCGNLTNRIQTITIRDTQAPSLFVPQNTIVEYGNSTEPSSTGTATGTDTCGVVTISYSDSVTTGCGASKTIARTWTARDECGNAANLVQTITVQDTTPPSLTCPPNLVLECPADTGTNATGVAAATDLSGSATISFRDASTNSCGAGEGILRTWTATDACGNSATAVQTILVHDTTRPKLVLPVNAIVECPGSIATNVLGTAVAIDDCGSTTITYSDAVTNLCGNTRNIARTWSAADVCGNTTNGVQSIQVRDLTPPTLVCPPNITLECPSDGGTNVAGSAVADDLCGSATLRFTDSIKTLCGASRIITRTWIASDECGNQTNRVQTITIRDTQAPAIALPQDRIVECGNSTAPSATGTASGVDTCGTVAISYSDSVTTGCGASKTIARTWTARDECGNATNAVQKITVQDTTPPSLVIPPNVVVECPGDTRTSATGMATAQDVCGTPSVTYSDTSTNGCGTTRTILRLWTATDSCGNTTKGFQTIAVVDTRKPALTCPPIAVQCPGDVPPAYANLALFLAAGGKATDTCDSALAFSLVSDSGVVGSCPGTVTRVYRAVDGCGNYTDAVQTITVRDTIPPVLTCPPALTIQCGDSLDAKITGSATAMDNCDTNVTLSYADVPVESSYSIKWYASDPNPDNAPFLPTYLKASPGKLPCVEEALRTGRAADPLRNAVAYGPSTNLLDAMTSLGGEPMYFGQVVPFQVVLEMSGGPGPENGTVEFTGSWSTHTTSNDDFGYDKNYMVYCAFVDFADPGTIDPHRNARVESYTTQLVGARSIDEQIRGTFRVSGLDVGDRVVVEIWVVLDSTAPKTVGGTIASELVAAWKPLNPPVPLSTGNQTVSIGNLSKMKVMPPIEEQPSQPPSPPLPPQPPIPAGRLVSVIDRMWTATDNCGNKGSCAQRISIRDSLAPSMAVPPDVRLEAPADTSTNNTGVATATDGCAYVRVSFTDSVVTNCGMSRVITRTWTATDGANLTNCNQVITVADTMPPVFKEQAEAEPSGFAIEDQWSFTDPVAVDACSPVTLYIVSTVTNSQDGKLFITRTWEAADDCGNKSQTSRMITVLAKPVISTDPRGLVLQYNSGTLLTVNAQGSGPLTYQWRRNGLDIPGAIGSSLDLAKVGFGDAGIYSVVVSNAAGIAISQGAIVNVAPILNPELSANVLKFSWPEGYALQYAGTPAGPYIDVPGASSPCTYDPAADPKKFFRLRSQFRVTVSTEPNGQRSVAVSGAPGCNFILQGSAGQGEWVNLTTNVGPFTYVDADAGLYPARTYRAVPLSPTGAANIEEAPVLTRQPRSQTAGLKSAVTLSAGFTASKPLLYQWQLNGRDIQGATSNSLTLSSLTYADAGVYRVIAGTSGDSVISVPAVLNVAPVLSASRNIGVFELSWDGDFILQAASGVNEPFFDVSPQPTSSHSEIFPGEAERQFFRLRSKPFSISSEMSNRTGTVLVEGSPGCNFVLQTSADLTHWVSIHTNTAPCNFTYTNDAPMTFFRVIELQ